MATVRIQLRRGTFSQWDSANPTLAAGEVGIETDTGKFKFGDGSTAWNSLDYALETFAANEYLLRTELGEPNGVASLDNSGKVPYSQIPSVDEMAQDAVNDALVAGTGITKTYNDGANTITVAVDTSVIATKAELAEVAQDSINDALTAGSGITKSYNDAANTLTVSVDTSTIAEKSWVTSNFDGVGSAANAAANAATALSNHENDTTGIHGIADTALLATKAYAEGYTDTREAAITTAYGNAITAHENDTTNIHGIADTSLLATKAYAEGYTDTQINLVLGAAPSALNTLQELAAAIDNDASYASTITSSLSLKANTSDVQNTYAPLASPTFTGTVMLPNSTHIGDVSATEIAYLNGVTSSIQTQIDTKADSSVVSSTYAPLASPTLTGTVTLPNTTSIGDVSATEIAYLNGVTSGVQTQIDAKLDSTVASSTYAPLASPTFTGNVGLPSSTNIGDVSNVEIGYLNGVTSGIQSQIDSKAPLASPTFTGNVGLPSSTNIGDVSNVEIGYLNGVTSGIQTQLDAKAPLESPTFTGTVILPNDTVTGAMIADVTIPTGKIADTAITASKLASSAVETAKINDAAVTTDKINDGAVTSAKIADGTIVNADINASAAIDWTKLAISSTVDSTEIGYVNGVTSAIQTQIDTKAPLAGPTFTGTVTLPGTTSIGDVSATEIGYVNGVTSAIQTQIDSKAASADVSSHTSATTSVHGISDTAQLAYKNAANQTFTGNLEVDGNMTVDGNLTVNGTTFNASATTITIEDNMVQLAHQNAANTVDLGLVVAYNDGTAKHAGIVRDVSANKWKLFEGVTDEPTTTVNFSQGTLDDLEVADITASSATIGDVSNTELQYLNGVTSSVQTQIDSKAPTASPTFTGTVTVAASGIAFTDGTQTKEGVPSRTTINSATGTYNLSTGGLALRDTLIECNSASAFTVTIPANSTTAYPVGTSIDLLQTGAGQITVAPAAGVTLNGTPGLKLRTQWSSATLFKRATDTWVIMGDLTA